MYDIIFFFFFFCWNFIRIKQLNLNKIKNEIIFNPKNDLNRKKFWSLYLFYIETNFDFCQLLFFIISIHFHHPVVHSN